MMILYDLFEMKTNMKRREYELIYASTIVYESEKDLMRKFLLISQLEYKIILQ